MKIHIEPTANFERNLDAIDAFWQERGVPYAYGDLLVELLLTVIPNLEQHPRFGRIFWPAPADQYRLKLISPACASDCVVLIREPGYAST